MKQSSILLLALTIITIPSIVLYTQTTPQEEELLFERKFYEQWSLEDLEEEQIINQKLGERPQNNPPAESYKISHTLQVNQSPHDLEQNIKARHIIIEAECEVQQVYNRKTRQIEFAVSYSKIDKKGDEFDIHTKRLLEEENNDSFENEKLQAENDGDFIYENVSQTSKGEIFEGEKQDGDLDVKIVQNRFYLVNADMRSGKITRIRGEAEYDEDEHITWITEMLINDLVPDSRLHSQNNRVVEENSLGKVSALYKSSVQGRNKLHLQKSWNQNDFQKVFDVQLPQMSYNRNLYLETNTGVVQSGSTVFSFSVGKQGLMALESGVQDENAGEFTGSINQKITKFTNNRDNMYQLSMSMMRYKQQGQFQDLTLSFNKKGSFGIGKGTPVNLQTQAFTQRDAYTQGSTGQNNYFSTTQDVTMIKLQEEQEEELVELLIQNNQQILEQQEQTQKLRASPLVYHSTSQIGHVKIFGINIHVDLIYNAYKDSQQIQVNTYVNKHLVSKLMDLKWNYCKDVSVDKMHNKKITLFKAVFPLLGIINIPVSASAQFNYGYTKQLQGGPGSCTFKLNPHFDADLYADGKVSALGIIDAGIYSNGKFMDVDLTFQSSQNRNQLSSSLVGNFKAFELDIGATYTKYNCSPKRWFKSGYEEEDSQEQEYRRNLKHIHIGRHIKKLTHRIHKVIKKAQQKVKKVVRVVRSGVKGIIETFCKRKQAYKQILHKKQNPHSKTLFRKSYNI